MNCKRLNWRFALTGPGLPLLLVVACSDLRKDLQNPNQRPTSTSTSQDPNGQSPDDIAFDSTSIDVAPGETVALKVTLSPSEGQQPVRIALFSSAPVAFLDKTETETDEAGVALFSLSVTATSEPFSVRAYSGDKFAELTINVTGPGVAQVHIEPKYLGARKIDSWNVRFAEDADCTHYSSFRGADQLAFDVGASIDLPNVPAQRPVTLLLSSRDYVFGCAVRTLEPGKQTSVPITLADRPLEVSNLHFPFSLKLGDTPELSQHLATMVDTMVSGFKRNGASDAATLLQQMADLSPSEEDFLATIIREDWEQKLVTALDPGGQTGLSSRIESWLRSGAIRLTEQALLSGTLNPTKSATDAYLDLDRVAGIEPATIQMPSQYGVSLRTEEQDEVRAGFKLFLLPSLLLSALAEVAAQDTPGIRGVVDGLEHSLEQGQGLFCPRVAEILSGSSPTPDAGALPDLAQLCHRALESRWAAVGAALGRAAIIDVTALGPTEIDDSAQVKGFSGNWVGTTDFLGTGPVALMGTFTSHPKK